MFTMDKSVMLLIDVQGQLAQLMYERESLFKSLQIMIQGMKILGVPIIWLEQIPKNLGQTREEIKQYMIDEQPIEKFAFSCCAEPAFMKKFEEIGRTQVFLTGIESHICVFQTAHDLIGKGCEVQVVSDCVSSRTRENKEIGIQRIMRLGGEITSVEMAFFELMKAAQGDQFRQLVRLIK
jgi:hypothetical protein